MELACQSVICRQTNGDEFNLYVSTPRSVLLQQGAAWTLYEWTATVFPDNGSYFLDRGYYYFMSAYTNYMGITYHLSTEVCSDTHVFSGWPVGFLWWCVGE